MTQPNYVCMSSVSSIKKQQKDKIREREGKGLLFLFFSFLLNLTLIYAYCHTINPKENLFRIITDTTQ